MNVTITDAMLDDVDAIRAVLRANRAEHSLFQQSRKQIERAIGEFLIARHDGRIVGCTAVHAHPRGSMEILAVAVDPSAQGLGVGSALMKAAIDRANAPPAPLIWLGTAKPDYFARHGFARMSRWRLPLALLIRKLVLVFRQPIRRWLPAVFGRHVFMVRR